MNLKVVRINHLIYLKFLKKAIKSPEKAITINKTNILKIKIKIFFKNRAKITSLINLLNSLNNLTYRGKNKWLILKICRLVN